MLIKKLKVIAKSSLCFFLAFLLVSPASAINSSYVQSAALNGSYWYNPDGTNTYGCNEIVANCDIRGDTQEERLWSGIRNYGFTPEQTAAIMGNTAHEGGTPVRQEDAYIFARNQNVLTQQGNPYTIWTYNNETHSAGMEKIYSRYYAGRPVSGIGLGNVQWTSKNRREGYLNVMESHGLLKYFEGDAYKKYGRLTDDQLRETIIEETGSDAEYWALWCAMLQYMYDELHGSYKAFLNKTSVDEMADYIAAQYEACSGCANGASSNLARRQTAAEIYQKYLDGGFDAVENGTASSATAGTAGSNATSTSSQETGSNVLIIGDSITNASQNSLKKVLPDATINAQDRRKFGQGVEILQSMNQNEIPQIIVFALGSNGGATETNAKKVLEIAGSQREVIFVTDYSLGSKDYTQNNTLFNSLKGSNKNVVIADWAAAVSGDPTKYIRVDPDGVDVHPTNPAGTDLFAKVIYEAVTNGTLQSANNQICATETYWNDTNLPSYDQCDPRWGNLYFGPDGINGNTGFTICHGGCGPSSFAIIATALLGREILPSETSDKAGLKGLNYYSPSSGFQGSAFGITSYLASEYGLQYRVFPSGSDDAGCIASVNQALQDGWMLHVSGGNLYGTGNAPFTPEGHLIGIVGLTQDGKWLIADSVSASRGHGNKVYEPSEVLDAGLNCNTLRGVKK